MKPDDVVVITGASSGIGLELARVYYNAGFSLSLAARSGDKLNELQRTLDPQRKRVLVTVTDVSIEEDCKHLIDRTLEAFGRIDILINNAGVTMRALFKDVDLKVLRQIMDVNFWGAVYCTHYAMPALLSSKGSVVGISSVAGYKGLPTRSGYSASKFALEGFLETLRIENLNTGLHVLIARPGFTATNIRNTMMDAKGDSQGESHKDEQRSLLPEAVANGIFKAVKKRRPYLLMSTTAILVFWLNKFFPSWVDRQMYKHVAAEKDSTLQ